MNAHKQLDELMEKVVSEMPGLELTIIGIAPGLWVATWRHEAERHSEISVSLFHAISRAALMAKEATK